MNQRRRRRKKQNSINYGSGTPYTSGMNVLETKKRRTIWPFLLVLVIIVAVGAGGYYWYQNMQNKEVEIVAVNIESPTLPRVVTLSEGYEVNELLPYVMEMEITTMRDAISILTPQGKLNLQVNIYDTEAETETLTYKIYSLDGSKLLQEDTVEVDDENQVSLDLSNVVTSVEESLLEISLTLSDGTQVYYYTRVIAYGSCYLSQNLDFIAQFHEDIFTKNIEGLADYVSEDDTNNSATYQVITTDSDATQISWGTMEPEILGEVKWTITECTSLFIAVQLEYQISMLSEADEDGNQTLEYYNVSESYRVGYSTSNSEVQLKQYQRTMNQIFTVDDETFETEGINLGIVDVDDITYEVNDDETVVAFVQERVLYSYSTVENQLVQVFTMEEINTEDGRYYNVQYDIRILSIDENGSMNFVVYGYMNRGDNEGQVGAAIYYYDALSGTLAEKAFIANNQSFAIGQDEMSQGIYYSDTLNVIYIIAQDAFYEVDLEENTQTLLSDNMDVSNYVISDDGKLIAFAISEEGSDEKCVVLDFETGESYTISTDEDTLVQPLGFLNHDFIYGEYRTMDTLTDETGSEITPMFVLEIRDEEGVVQKTYEQENQYIRDIAITDNMVTMNLLELDGDEYVYAGQDVITNNETQTVSSVELTTYTSESMLQQVRLVYEIDEENISEVSVAQVQLIANDGVIRISYDNVVEDGMYYAYAYGEIQVISSMASEAIQYASDNVGTVINSDNKYVWRSGYRDLTYTVTNYSDLKSRMSSGESAIDIVSESANQNVVSYTGCTTEQMCYLLNNGQMIAAKLQDESWIMLVGYTGSTMYYLDSDGSKLSITMTSLDSQVMELIGDGIF